MDYCEVPVSVGAFPRSRTGAPLKQAVSALVIPKKEVDFTMRVLGKNFLQSMGVELILLSPN